MHRALAVVALAGLVPAARAQFTFDTNLVLHDLEWNNPTSTAMDDAGVIHTAFMKQHHTDSATKEIWYASNAGGAWSFTQITDNAVREEFPCLRLDAAGNVHLSFHTGVATTNQIRYVNNVGGSFGPIIEITDPGFVIVKHAIDSSGTVHFVFESQSGGLDDVYYRTWSPGGGLGPLVNLSNSPLSDDSAAYVAVGPDDTVHVAWQAGNPLGGPLRYANNAGGSFVEAPTGTAGNVMMPVPLVGPDGKVSIVYERANAALLVIDDGATGVFGPETTLFSGGNPAFWEGHAVDIAGRRHVGFVSNSGAEGVFVVSETHAGWGAPQPLHALDQTRNGISVAINRWGTLAVTFQFGAFDSQAEVVFADIWLSTAPTIGDLDRDGDVDDGDVSSFLLCMAGPDITVPPGGCDAETLARSDADGDADADLADVALLQGAFTGP